MRNLWILTLLLASTVAQAEVRSQACPFSCRSESIPKSQCRDWREGNMCFVEDLRSGGAVSASPASGEEARAAECSAVRRGDLSRPSIEISQERPSGQYFDDDIRISGAIEGNCLSEAGYYENGRKVEDIPVLTSRDFKRFEFDIKGREDRMGEVRVYNVLGDRDIYELGGTARGRYGRDPLPYNPLDIMGR